MRLWAFCSVGLVSQEAERPPLHQTLKSTDLRKKDSPFKEKVHRNDVLVPTGGQVEALDPNLNGLVARPLRQRHPRKTQ